MVGSILNCSVRLREVNSSVQFVKGLHEKNLIVPVSGDFGGDKALRAIGAWLHKHGGTVSAFYVSNVEQYLFQDDKNRAFYENVGTLPMTDASVFIRPYSLRRHSAAAALCPIAGFLKAEKAGRVRVLPWGVHGRLRWRDLDTSPDLRVTGTTADERVEWEVPMER